MVLKSLEVVNFRNLAPTKITFSPKVNIFYGDNAQGKTNFMEAIYLLSFIKSLRAETDQELLQWDKNEARLKGEFDSQTLSILLRPSGKEIRVNNTVTRALEALGELRVASFSPEDILIVTGAPTLRRRFLDSLISLVNRQYLYNLVNLQKVIKNRNRVLFFLKEGRLQDLGPWDDQLVEYASKIWLERFRLANALNEIISPLSKQLLGTGILQIDYQPKISITAEDTPTTLGEKVRRELAKVKAEERRRATTLIGPQRDDFSLLVEETKNDKVIYKDIGVYGSRGEQRVGILSLKIGELDLIEKEVGERPLLLLDDVLSEFDKSHRDHLFARLNKQQTFITTTELALFPPSLLKDAQLMLVEEGKAELIKPED